MAEESAVFPHGRADAADGAAIDACGTHGDKEAPVKPRIPCEESLVALVWSEVHDFNLSENGDICSPFSDIKFQSDAGPNNVFENLPHKQGLKLRGGKTVLGDNIGISGLEEILCQLYCVIPQDSGDGGTRT